MTMPEMTGAAMARKILQLKPETSVIIVTGHSDQIDRKKAAREGTSLTVGGNGCLPVKAPVLVGF